MLRSPHAWSFPSRCLLVLALVALAGCQSERDRLLNEYKVAARPELRAAALSGLAEKGHEDDFHLFLQATRDPSALVRKAAARGLGKSGDAKAIDTLGELLGDPDYDVQREAAHGLAKFNTDKARAYLLSAFGRRDGPARAAIAAALGSRGVTDAILHEAKQLWARHLKALEAGGPAERVGAAEEMGRSGRGEAVERLLPLLGDDSVLLAAGSARGLGAAGDKRAVPSLVGVLRENYPVLREAAAEALGVLGDPGAIPALEKVALEAGPGAVAAVNAISRLAASVEGKASLCKLAAEGSADVAALAARHAKARQGCPAEPLQARLGKGGADTLAALAALEGLGTSVVSDKLAERLAGLLDGERPVRLGAARALASLEKAPDAVGAKVVKLLESETERLALATQKWVKEKLPEPGVERVSGDTLAPIERDRAKKFNDMMAKVDALNEARAQALGVKLVDRDSERGVLDLADDLADGEEELVAPLARAAVRLKAPAAQAALERLIQEARPSARAAACEALGMLATPAALDHAARCLDSPDRIVIRAAAQGLSRGGPAAVPVLVAGLKRRSSERPELIRALGVLQAREAAPKLTEFLTAGGSEALEAAVALGRCGDPSVAKALAERLKEHPQPARLELIQSLGQLGDAGVAPALQQEIFSERAEVRAEAARALGKVARKESAAMLEALRFDYYAEVRRAAEEALGTAAADAQGAR